MIIILTGLSGSGKTAILKDANIENSFYADDYIKNVLYKKGSKLYEEIRKSFGDEVVDDERVITSKLGKIVFSNKEDLIKLNKLVVPFVREWFKGIRGNAIVEMASYINYKEDYHDLVDKVILVKKDKQIIKDKFEYMDVKRQPILNRDISPDFTIENNGTVKEASEKLTALYLVLTE